MEKVSIQDAYRGGIDIAVIESVISDAKEKYGKETFEALLTTMDSLVSEYKGAKEEYQKRQEEIKLKKAAEYEKYTTGGQCAGKLSYKDGEVVDCCCEKMANEIVYGSAFVSECGVQITSMETADISVDKGKCCTMYTDDIEVELVYDDCPYCGAKLEKSE